MNRTDLTLIQEAVIRLLIETYRENDGFIDSLEVLNTIQDSIGDAVYIASRRIREAQGFKNNLGRLESFNREIDRIWEIKKDEGSL